MGGRRKGPAGLHTRARRQGAGQMRMRSPRLGLLESCALHGEREHAGRVVPGSPCGPRPGSSCRPPRYPSGFQAIGPSGLGVTTPISVCRLVPSGAMVASLPLCTKAIRDPSGDHAGQWFSPSWVTCRRPDPSALMTKISPGLSGSGPEGKPGAVGRPNEVATSAGQGGDLFAQAGAVWVDEGEDPREVAGLSSTTSDHAICEPSGDHAAASGIDSPHSSSSFPEIFWRAPTAERARLPHRRR